MKGHHKPAEVAMLWRCTAEHVLDVIRDGRLRAFSLSKPGSKRPRWLITDEAIAEYESQHQARPAVKPVRRQRKRTDGVIEFYK
jgi:hypothetical protein